MITWELRSFIRRGSARVLGPEALARYQSLGPAQPLTLLREPGNKEDPHAVRLRRIMGDVGYVAREHAGEVSARLREGQMLLCKTLDNCGQSCDILIWSEGHEHINELSRVTKKRKPVLVGALDGVHDVDDDNWGDR